MAPQLIKHSDPIALAKRIFHLAFEASSCMGLGFLQDRGGATEEEVWTNVTGSGDYPGDFKSAKEREDGMHVHGDYVQGRMMKLFLVVSGEGVFIPTSEARSDYQSWCSTYPSYAALAKAAEDSL